jgi:hypothetical protein
MRVIAVRPGFFGSQLRLPDTPSAVFDCPPEKLGRWMKLLEPIPAFVPDGGATIKRGVQSPTLADALARLNPEDEAHWTKAGPSGSGGLPALPVLTEYAGFKVTRHMVEQAAPGFNRDAALAALGAAVDGGAGA